MLIIPQLPDVEPSPTETYHSDNRGTRNVYIRKTDFEKFGCAAGCPACEVRRAGLPTSGQGHTAECRKRLEDAMTTDTSTATRVKATRVRQAERIIKDLDDSGRTCPIFRSSTWIQTRKVTQKCRLAVRRHPLRARDLQRSMLNAWKRELPSTQARHPASQRTVFLRW